MGFEGGIREKGSEWRCRTGMERRVCREEEEEGRRSAWAEAEDTA